MVSFCHLDSDSHKQIQIDSVKPNWLPKAAYSHIMLHSEFAIIGSHTESKIVSLCSL